MFNQEREHTPIDEALASEAVECGVVRDTQSGHRLHALTDTNSYQHHNTARDHQLKIESIHQHRCIQPKKNIGRIMC